MHRLMRTSGLTQSTDALGRLATAEEEARYARTLAPAGDLSADGRAVRHELAALAGSRRRWAARVVPRSTVGDAASFVANRIADVLDVVDAAFGLVARLFMPRRLRRAVSR